MDSSKGEDFHEVYDVMEKVGEGVYGQVYRCVDKENKKEFAVKMICTSRVKEDIIKEEIEICKKLDHRNVVKLIDFYVKDIVHFLVFDMVYGGQLFDDIVDRSQYSEFDACQCIEQILKGVRYLHKLNIVHRDLKASNILLTNKDKDAVVKIADFGTAGVYDETEFFLFTGEARSYYMSPEMCSKRLSRHKVDIWSCGVLLFMMLVGRPPFHGRGQSLIDQMNERKYSFTNDAKNDLCDDAKDLMDKLLDPNPITRVSANDALQHRFIRERKTVTSRFHRQNTIEELKKHKAEIQDKWRRAISAVMFKKASAREVANLTRSRTGSVRSMESISEARKLGAIGRSSAIDHADEAKVNWGVSSSDADKHALEEADVSSHDAECSAEELDATNTSVENLSFLESIANAFDEWCINSSRVILYPIILIFHFLRGFLRLIRRGLN